MRLYNTVHNGQLIDIHYVINNGCPTTDVDPGEPREVEIQYIVDQDGNTLDFTTREADYFITEIMNNETC